MRPELLAMATRMIRDDEGEETRRVIRMMRNRDEDAAL